MCYVAEDGYELLTLLALDNWDYKCVPACLVCGVVF